MFESVELKNFKRHESLSVEFDGGVTSITGPNAGGKSSLLKALLFAMFGSSAAGKKDSLWNWATTGERSVDVAMTLPEHGRVHIIRTPNGAQIISAPDGRPIASGSTAVTKLIEESLGMLAKDLRTLMYSPQGETQGILTMGPAVLQGKVESLAKIDVIDKVLDQAGTDVTKLDGRLEGMQVPPNLDEIRAKIEDLDVAVKYYSSEADGSAQLAEQLRINWEAKQREIQAGRENNDDIQKLLARHENITENLVTYDRIRRDALGRLNEVPTYSNLTIATKEGELAERVSKRDQLKVSVSQANNTNSRIERLTTKVQDLTRDVDNHNGAVAALEGLDARYAELLENLRPAELADSQAAAEVLQWQQMAHNAVCPTCKRAMDGLDPENIKVNQDKAHNNHVVANRLVVGLKAQLREVANEQQAYRDLLAPMAATTLQAYQDELGTLEAMPPEKVQEVTEQVAALEKLIEDVQVWLFQAGGAASARERLENDIKSYDTQLADLNTKSAQLLAEIRGRKVVDVKHLDAQAANMAAEQNDVVIAYNDWKSKATAAHMEKAGLERELAAGEAVKVDYQKATTEKSQIETLQKYLRKNRARFADDIWGGLLNYASALVSNTTNGRLTNLNRSSSGDFTVEEDGRAVSVEDSSGAQRSIMGLALRIAMTKVFFGKDLPLLLDEVSADARDDTAAMIAGMLKSLDMQVISVTHRNGDAVNSGTVVEIGK